MRKPKAQSHIVNHLAFSDAALTIGGASTTYQSPKGPLPKGPPRYVQGPGRSTKTVTDAKGVTNKRY